MSDTIDAVDYAILKCLAENDGCWKKQIHDWVNAHVDELPAITEKSAQTIGRRTDKLHEQGFIESCILSAESVNRDLMIGYKLAEPGRNMLQEKRRELLRGNVIQSAEAILTGDTGQETDIERKALIGLMVDAFNLDEHTRENLLPQLDTEEITGLIAVHFFRKNAGDTFDAANEEVLVEFLQRTPRFREPFEHRTIIERVRAKVSQGLEQYRDAASKPLVDAFWGA